ncbi:MAG: peptide deformylase [Gammaproteobacteria bacterium]|jgi:peptide deformylase|nr:peptide deformylase [Gammaproteobacteria bacterium]
MPLDLVTIEHSPLSEILTKPAQVVTFPLSTEDKLLIEQMQDLLLKLKGVGLAAPQVGVTKQIIMINIQEDAIALRKDAVNIVPLTVFINPQYIPLADAKIVYDWEGCFSVVQTTGKVPRYDKIQLNAYTPEGKKISSIIEGFTARVLQHEIDHINGFLITHRLTPDCLQGHPDKMLAIRYRELNHAQKEIVKKIIHEREKVTNPNDKAQVQALNNMKKFLYDDN